MAKNVAVVLGSFHKQESLAMLEEVHQFASENQLNIVEEIWVPGSMEKPLALKMLLSRDDVDGAVVLGIIEKGETSHGFVMASSVIDVIVDLQLQYMKPVGVGILGPDISASQIPSRVRPYAKAAIAAMNTMFGVLQK